MFSRRNFHGENYNSRVMKFKMADVLKPMMGISIKELDQRVFLFQFLS